MSDPIVSIIIVNHNGREHVHECLDALMLDCDLPFEIIIVDNASADESMDVLEQYEAPLHLIRNEENLGYSRAINIGVQHARGEYLAVLNMDIVVERGWLSPLIRFLQAHPRTGIVAPVILRYGLKDRINAIGQNIHVTGLGFNRKLDWSREHIDPQPVRVSGVQGGAFVMPMHLFRQLGGMNEAYFLYHEDVELSLLVTLAGYDIYAVTDSFVYHKYNLHMTARKLNWLERHRWMTMLSAYRWRTLMILLPLFLLTEGLMGVYCLTRGMSFLKAKARAIAFVGSHRHVLRESRRRMQSMRRVSDIQLLQHLRWWYDIDQFLTLAQQRGGWLREALFGLLSRRAHDRTA